MTKEGELSPEQIAAAKEIIAAELTLLPYDALFELFQQSPDFLIDGGEPLTEIDFINQIMLFGEQQVGEVDDETKLMMGVLSMEAMFDNLESFKDNPVKLLINFITENKAELTELKIEDKQELIDQMIAKGWKYGVITHWLIHLKVLKDLNFEGREKEWLHKYLFALDVCSEYSVVELRENSEVLLLFK